MTLAYADGQPIRKGDAVLRDGSEPLRVHDVLDGGMEAIVLSDGTPGLVGTLLHGADTDCLELIERDSPDFLAAGVRFLLTRAQAGDEVAQASLGWMYANGKGVPQDDVKALAWFHKAALQGEPTAQYALGCRYELGNGVAVDMKEAVRWYAASAEQGLGPAICNLADKYERGAGVERDMERAMTLYRRAAAAGVIAARERLKREEKP